MPNSPTGLHRKAFIAQSSSPGTVIERFTNAAATQGKNANQARALTSSYKASFMIESGPVNSFNLDELHSYSVGKPMLAANLKLLDIYSKVTTCEQGCTGIENKPKEGIIGRSFYCPSDVANVTILLVSKNPGKADPRENSIYAPLDGAGRVAAHTQFVHDCFAGINTLVTSQYHARIVRWVSKILDVEATPEAVFAHTAMTALVKCQSCGDKTDRLSDEAVGTCADKYLFSEIETIRPRFLLALGGEAYNYLMLPAVRARHGLPVGKLYHPSWSNMRGGEARYIDEELSKLRKQYQDAL